MFIAILHINHLIKLILLVPTIQVSTYSSPDSRIDQENASQSTHLYFETSLKSISSHAYLSSAIS